MKAFYVPADPRTTLRALTLTGSHLGERSSDFPVQHRRTDLTGLIGMSIGDVTVPSLIA